MILLKNKIYIYGIVQGVGFRPFVARLAKEHNIRGAVRNALGHVAIEAVGTAEDMFRFVCDLEKRKPEGSVINSIRQKSEPLAGNAYVCHDFTIEPSGGDGEGPVMPAPDIAVCDDCVKELFAPGDPRRENPFISCTRCGPRFSIMRCAPYDRENTSMGVFRLCSLCESQYKDPADRRFHAQTVCCNNCGPVLRYQDREGRTEGKPALSGAVNAVSRGGIIAVKGIGGYHMACSPFDEAAVLALRELKGRESKPFAVMFPDIGSLRDYCEISKEEEKLLAGAVRPIVLLKRKNTAVSEAVYTSSPYLGAFLPYAPLQHLILRETGPLVMTSANISSLPIICDDSEMLRFLENNEKLSGVLLHNRNMLRRLDDSVAEVVLNKPHIIRRARGYVPKTIQIKPDKQSILAKPISILALGAQEKNTVCLYRDGYAYVSAEVGDLNNLETEAVFRDTIADMRELLRIKPDLAVCDLHPGYASVKYAEELGIPVLKVQHHHAHIASVMAEHGLTEPVIGIAFDGTGYGADGTVWGGEFLIASPEGFTRAGHIKPAAFLGSDESVKQGRISAACMLYDAGIGSPDDKTAIIYAALSRGINTVRSSSMGRVFDAVSSILDICHESEYSGQCAVELENAAAEYLPDGNGNPEPFPYDIKEEGGQAIIDLTPCIKEIYRLYNNGENKNALAWRFHITVCGFIVEVCEKIAKKTGVYRVALSGGVFQNRILTENTFPALQKAGFAVYRNVSVPAGDGGISLGQVYIGMNNA